MTDSIQDYGSFEIRIRTLGPHRHGLEARSPAGTATIDLGHGLTSVLKHHRVARYRPEGEVMREASIDPPRAARRHRGLERSDSVTVQGKRLFKQLFPDSVGDLWRRSLARAEREDQGLCIRLHFDLRDPQQAQLAQVPWELLFDTGSESFLAQSASTPIVRYLDLPGRVPEFRLPTRLRILVVVSAPKNLAALHLRSEVDALRNGSWQDNVDMTLVQMPSLQMQAMSTDFRGREDLGVLMRRELRRREYHVLHFMGHGDLGDLFFENPRRGFVPVSGRDLAVWLTNCRTLRLVVLNACSSARFQDLRRPFTGVAQALVRGGVPGVLAMQESMPDADADAFSRAFYGRLADGTPVEAALSYARQKLHSRDPESSVWSTPALFQRTPEVLKMPPKAGPALARLYTFWGLPQALFSGLLFAHSRLGNLPFFESFLHPDVAALYGFGFGILFYGLTLYIVFEYSNVVRQSESESGDQGARIARCLPRLFGRRPFKHTGWDAAYRSAVFGLIGLLPMLFHLSMLGQLIAADVYDRRRKVVYVSGIPEQLTTYIPLDISFLNDNFRLGQLGSGHVIDNGSYFPFWTPWGFLSVTVATLTFLFYLLRRLIQVDSDR